MARESMIAHAYHWFCAPKQNFLRWGIAVSLLFHAIILAWSYHPERKEADASPALEVVLVNAFSEQAPLAPQVIAQANLEGGGEQSSQIASNPSEIMGEQVQDIALEAMTRQRQALQDQQQQLLTQLMGLWPMPDAHNQHPEPDNESVQGTDPVDQQALEMNARIAAILKDIEQYNSRPRKHFDAPSAIANRYSGYVEAWRRAVEKVGSEHYPSQGDYRPSGTLQATVTINAQGQLVDVVIDKPASDPLLNQAVRRILQIAGPFAPFPPSIASEIDQLVITRTWEFRPGKLTTHQP